MSDARTLRCSQPSAASPLARWHFPARFARSAAYGFPSVTSIRYTISNPSTGYLLPPSPSIRDAPPCTHPTRPPQEPNKNTRTDTTSSPDARQPLGMTLCSHLTVLAAFGSFALGSLTLSCSLRSQCRLRFPIRHLDTLHYLQPIDRLSPAPFPQRQRRNPLCQ